MGWWVFAGYDWVVRVGGHKAVVYRVELVDVPLVFRKDDRLAMRKDQVGTEERGLKGR